MKKYVVSVIMALFTYVALLIYTDNIFNGVFYNIFRMAVFFGLWFFCLYTFIVINTPNYKQKNKSSEDK